MADEYLGKKYDINPENGNCIIKIDIHKYENIFNNLDDSPLFKKDIDPELRDFLYDCSYEIPQRHGLELCFKIKGSKRDEVREKLIISWFKAYCLYYMRSRRRALKRLYYQMIRYIIISFIFLFAGFSLDERAKKGVLLNVIIEGLIIGGWVFLWQTIAYFTVDRKDRDYEIKTLKRLYDAPLYFKYENTT